MLHVNQYITSVHSWEGIQAESDKVSIKASEFTAVNQKATDLDTERRNISTQMVLEMELISRKIERQRLSRENLDHAEWRI